MLLLIDALKSVMAKERRIYTKLTELAEEKKDYIIQDNLEKIKEMMRLDEDALKALQDLEAEKIEILQAIAKNRKLDHLPDLSEIIHILQDEDEKEELRNLQKDFHQLVSNLKTKNELNQQLLQTQMQYTSFCLELITQPSSVGDLYGNTGQIQEGTVARVGLLDREV